MEKVLEKKKVVKKVSTPKVDAQVQAVEKLTMLNSTLVDQVKSLSTEIDSIKNKLRMVSSRLGL